MASRAREKAVAPLIPKPEAPSPDLVKENNKAIEEQKQVERENRLALARLIVEKREEKLLPIRMKLAQLNQTNAYWARIFDEEDPLKKHHKKFHSNK